MSLGPHPVSDQPSELVVADRVKARVVPVPLGRSGQGLAVTGTF